MNHKRCKILNQKLKALGFSTWFDEERMHGNIHEQMVSGIDSARVVLVCITERYVDKVASPNANDNCKLEFNYATRTKTSSRMVPVVMEATMRDSSRWKGNVGMVLGGHLYADMCSMSRWNLAPTDEQVASLAAMITKSMSIAAEAESKQGYLGHPTPQITSRSSLWNGGHSNPGLSA